MTWTLPERGVSLDADLNPVPMPPLVHIVFKSKIPEETIERIKQQFAACIASENERLWHTIDTLPFGDVRPLVLDSGTDLADLSREEMEHLWDLIPGPEVPAISVAGMIYDAEKGPPDDRVETIELGDDDPTQPGLGPASVTEEPLVVGIPRMFQAPAKPCYCCARKVEAQIRLNDGTRVQCCLDCAESQLGYVLDNADGLLRKKSPQT